MPECLNAQCLCNRCGERPAVARVTVGAAAESLCEICLRIRVWEWNGDTRHDLARFFLMLAQPARAAIELEMPPMDPNSFCRTCGLRYAELEAAGMCGCPDCYTAFETALLPALVSLGESLHS